MIFLAVIVVVVGMVLVGLEAARGREGGVDEGGGWGRRGEGERVGGCGSGVGWLVDSAALGFVEAGLERRKGGWLGECMVLAEREGLRFRIGGGAVKERDVAGAAGGL